MEKINDGGPAFPTEPNTQPGRYVHHGMSLRDWIAGQFFNGAVIATPDIPLDVKDGADQFYIDCALREYWGQLARTSYIAADAMIAARGGVSAVSPTERAMFELLCENASAWEDEEESVREDHDDLIAKTEAFIEANRARFNATVQA